MYDLRQTEVFARWLQRLADERARARIAERLARLERGQFGDAKSVGRQVTELRIDYGPGYRVYFTRRGGQVIVLLCGGDKDGQKRDLRRAQELAADLED